jgi:membrane associated rhomboid family serine protease
MEPLPAEVVILRGSRQLCNEYSLVLEARGLEHTLREVEGGWMLTVPASLLDRAAEEVSRYSQERSAPRRSAPHFESHPGAALGSIAYAAILLLTAYCAGNQLFGFDWLVAGDLDAGAGREWWRVLTALTLHVDQEHLLGNLLFGLTVGIAAGRLLGPGVAWGSILAAAALANTVETILSPPTHHAIGASTAVFAGLGLLVGMAWQPRLTARERAWYRWAPMIAGISLLTLLGAGGKQVDVLGHGLGFLFGVTAGWLCTRFGIERNRASLVQWVAGTCALVSVLISWTLAILHAAPIRP